MNNWQARGSWSWRPGLGSVILCVFTNAAQLVTQQAPFNWGTKWPGGFIFKIQYPLSNGWVPSPLSANSPVVSDSCATGIAIQKVKKKRGRTDTDKKEAMKRKLSDREKKGKNVIEKGKRHTEKRGILLQSALLLRKKVLPPAKQQLLKISSLKHTSFGLCGNRAPSDRAGDPS